MKTRRFVDISVLIFIFVLLVTGTATAQTTSVFASGLNRPIKIIDTKTGHFLVSESGTTTPNSGRISIFDDAGNRRTLIAGLPSGLSMGASLGPAGLELQGRTLYVAITEGNSVMPGPIGGTTVPNPNPSSPLFSSVLALHFSANVERTTEGFSLTLADHFALQGGQTLTLSNGSGDTLTVELVVDFPNYIPNPLPNFAGNVRNSNPFSLTVFRGDLYVANAGLNAVFGVDLQSGAVRTVTTFAPVPNPLFPTLGPPASDAVPDSIRVFENQFLVPLLVGFPFAPAVSSVRVVDPRSGTNQVFIGGLTRSIDILPVKERGSTHFLVLEYSTNFLGGAPGRLLSFSSPSATPTIVAGGLSGPTNMVRDEKTGDIFITAIGSGQIIRVQP
jgi:hypothetical protein